jgi:uncharacterized damage-inducible protein DinB
MTTKNMLLRQLEQSYATHAWHGSNLKGSLRGLTPKQLIWRPGKNRHNIWEIAIHCAYWKYAVRRRILGEKRGSFPLQGSNWFIVNGGKPQDWRHDMTFINLMHKELIAAVKKMKPAQLRKKSGKYTFAELILGVASHDVYHAGQIQLLKRLQKK